MFLPCDKILLDEQGRQLSDTESIFIEDIASASNH